MCEICERWKQRMIEAKANPKKKALIAKLFYYHRIDKRYHQTRRVTQ